MWKVFLSSTARDLADYRQAVYEAIHRLDGFHCVRMEDFGARDTVADTFCREKVAECDLVVLLAGLCYGSRPQGVEESYTQQEYRAAVEAQVPRLVFLSAENEFYPGVYREPDALWERQQTFRSKLKQERLIGTFHTPEDLAHKVVEAISNWAKSHSKQEKTSSFRKAAEVRGGGAIAQGPGAVAAGEGGVAVGRDVHGNITITNTNSTSAAKETETKGLREAYLGRVMEQCGYLLLTGIDPAAATRGAEARLRLEAVYTALLTQTPEASEQGLLKSISHKAEGEQRRLSALEQLDRHGRLVLQGDPGSGKTTFAHFVALCLAGELLGHDAINLQQLTAPLPDEEGHDRDQPQPWTHRGLLPVVVVLRDFAAQGLPPADEKATAEHLWHFIEESLTAASLGEYAPYLKQNFQQEGGLILLDGLDEVPEAEQRRGQVTQAVEDFVASFGRCRFLVTSRTYAYQKQDWKLTHFAEAILAPLEDGQIRRFISRWYGHAAELGRCPPTEAEGRAALLERAIFSQPQLREMAARPLLLTLMASLHAWRGGTLPEKRERLYADTVDLLLDVWERARIIRDGQGKIVLIQPSLAEWLEIDREAVRDVLEGLAFEAHAKQPELTGTADIPEDALAGRLMRLSPQSKANPARLVEYLRDRAGLLTPQGVGVYTFPHRSFQEYLAACHLTGDTYPDEVAQLARQDPDRWREVVLLAGAKAARGSSASIWHLAEALCYQEPEEPEAGREAWWGAQLAGQALVESAKLDKLSPPHQQKLKRVRRWLVKLMGEETLPATERVLAGNSLAQLGDPRFDPEHGYLPAEPLLGFVAIPAGTFTLGSDAEEDSWFLLKAKPPHSVTLPRFYLARWPVTVAQFRAFVEASEHQPADPNCLKGFTNHPVVLVTWRDALAYCHWLGEQLRELAQGRLLQLEEGSESERAFWQGLAEGALTVTLPSEAEWEKVAKGEEGRAYPWGNEPDANKANYGDTGIGDTSPVGCFPGGVSPYGCEEMSGNVGEWTRSLADDYPYPDQEKPRRQREDLRAEGRRVLRGGAFSYFAELARCAFRYLDYPDLRFDLIGFRVVVSPFSLTDESSDL